MGRALKSILIALLIVVPAGLAGYAVSRQIGPSLLRAEIEAQLSRRLKGEVRIGSAGLALRGGLRVETHRLTAYPEGAAGPALTVDSAVAEIDLMQLALGRFRLAWLRIEGAHFRISHSAQDEWRPYPIARLADRPTAGKDLERRLVLLRAFEEATRWLLEKPILARKVELTDSKISYLDWRVPAPDGNARGEPYTLELDSIDGELRHHWISREADLTLRAELRTTGHYKGSLEAEGRHRPDDGLRLAVAATAVDLTALSPYATDADSHAHTSGLLSGVVAFDTAEPGHGRLELDWMLHQLDAVLPLGGYTVLPVETERGSLEAEIEMHPGRLRLSSARAAGRDITLEISGTVERPLRESAPMRITADLQGLTIEEGGRFVERLPEEDRATLTQLLDRVEAGHIRRMGGTGSARISQWRRLLSGELAQLPPGFVLRAELDDVVLSAGDDLISDVSGRIEWSADRLEVRDGRGRWNDLVLPKLSGVVEGASKLFADDSTQREMRSAASELPGLRTLADVLFSGQPEEDSEADDPNFFANVPPLQIRFSRLDHPLLRWPIEDARVDLRPGPKGAELDLSARWAGAPIRAEAVWLAQPEPAFNFFVAVGRHGGELEPEPVEPPKTESAQGKQAPWALGHFEIGASLGGRFRFEAVGGEFVASGSRIDFDEVRVSLPNRGNIQGQLHTELGREGIAGVELQFRMQDAELPTVAHAIGLPPDFASGSASASGAVAGVLRTDRPLISGLRGSVEFEARDGDLKMRIPMLVAIAQATEGFNPLAERDEVHYELARARLEIAESRIWTERFMLEGPMRVFASGAIDLSEGQGTIDAVVGVFLFRQAASTLGAIPVFGALISDKGLLGAYFRVEGMLTEPDVRALPLTSLAEAVPDIIKAPIKMLGFVLKGPRQRQKERRQRQGGELSDPELLLPAPAAPEPTPDPEPPPS